MAKVIPNHFSAFGFILLHTAPTLTKYHIVVLFMLGGR